MNKPRRSLPHLYAILDFETCRVRELDPYVLATQWLEAGIRFIQIRGKQLRDLEYWRFASSIASLKQDFPSAIFTINGRADMGFALRLDGVHLPEKSIPIHGIDRVFPDALIVRSCHETTEFEVLEYIDAMTLSPLFSPLSKDDSRALISFSKWAFVEENASIPVYALGGITPARIEEYNLQYVAVLGYLTDPKGKEAAFRLLDALRVQD